MKEATRGCTVKAGASLDARKPEEKRHSWWGPSEMHACWQEVKGAVLPGGATEGHVQHHGQGLTQGRRPLGYRVDGAAYNCVSLS